MRNQICITSDLFTILAAFLIASALLLIFSTAVSAQSDKGSLLGTVRDSAGAVVPGASITATHVQTALERKVLTDDGGGYVIPELPIGTYQVAAEITGFKRTIINGIVLQMEQKQRVDIVLEIGQITEDVQVTGDVSLIKTDSSSVSYVISNRQVVDLPLNGRNFVQLATLVPGVTARGSNQLSFNGSRPTKTIGLLDGVANTEQLFAGIQFSPSIDAIQEFSVQASNFSAEYGLGPGIINTSLKAGSNDFHGSAFEFLRNDIFDARNFFSATKPVLRRNQFGFAVGGPIRTNRTFFFVNFDGTRLRSGLTFRSPVPSDAQKAGDFSGRPPIFDPLTTRPNPAGAGFIRDPFPGNRIPSDQISPQAKFFLKFWPAPNTPDGFFVSSPTSSTDVDQWNVRIDHRIGTNDNFYARYAYNNLTSVRPGPFSAASDVGTLLVEQRTQNIVLGETHIFSPSLMNEFKLGFGRLFTTGFTNTLGTNFTVDSGIQGFEETSLLFPGMPNFSIAGITTWAGNNFAPSTQTTNNYQLIDNATYTKSQHTIKAGTDIRNYRWYSTNSASSEGSFSFSGTYSTNPLSPAGTGSGFADFLLGLPASAARSFPRDRFANNYWNYHFYLQDDWKITPRLTLNLGLRYELNTWPTDSRNQIASFDTATGRIIVASTSDGTIDLTAQQVGPAAFAQFGSRIIPASSTDLPLRTLRFVDKNNFAPRFGFAWRPFGTNTTVVRGGYGVYYAFINGNGNSALIINPPFIVDEVAFNNNPIPNRNLTDFFQSPVGLAFVPPSVNAFNPRQRTPYVQQWNLVIQKEITGGVVIDVGYVGSKGTKLEREVQMNVPAPGPGPIQARRPLPVFSRGTIRDGGASSTYHGLQLKAEKRFSDGLSFLSAYTWSKSIDDTSTDAFGGPIPQNPENLRLERSVSDFDIPHRLVFSYIYELPVGKGRRFLGNVRGLPNQIVGGWQIAGITTLQSGTPFTPTIATDRANTGTPQRPNRLGSGRVANPSPDQWFNPRDFALPAPFTFGNSGRNILRTDGIVNFDFALFKNFPIGERFTTQFRAESFNLFNHTTFGAPAAAIDTSTAGRVFSASPARVMQFSIKFLF